CLDLPVPGSDAGSFHPEAGAGPTVPADAAPSRDASSPPLTDGAATGGAAIDAPAEATSLACTYGPSLAPVPDASTVGPWATGSDHHITGLARERQGNVFAGGTMTNQAFYLAKFDATGTLIWSKSIGGDLDAEANGLAVDAEGSVVVAATTRKADGVSLDFGAGPVSAGGLVLKYDRNGAIQFQRFFPMADNGNSFPFMNGVVVLSSGDIVVGGSLQGTVDFGGGPLTAKGGISAFLARFGPCGAFESARQFGSSIPDHWSWTYGLAVNGTDQIVMTGIFEGGIDFGAGELDAPANSTDYDAFIARFDASGAPIASRDLRTADPNGMPGVPAIDDDGNAVMVGRSSQPIDLGGGDLAAGGTLDAYVAKYGPKLEYVWGHRFTGADQVGATAATIDSEANIVFTGWLSGDATFGGFALHLS